LWAYDTDRLGRTSALSSQVVELVESRPGREVFISTAPHPVGQKTIAHRYAPMFQGVRSDEEQRRRVEKHRTGMQNRVANLGLPGPRWPVGYVAVRDERGRCAGGAFDELIGAVQLLTDWFLEGLSYREMTRRINESAYPAPANGKRWYSSAVRRILANDHYAGYVRWGSHHNEVASSRFPALWDEEIYSRVIAERRRRARGPYVHRGGGPYTGIAFCGRCGARMTRRKAGSGRWFLRCGTHTFRKDRGQGCHPNNIPQEDVTRAVRAFLTGLAEEDVLDRLLAERQPVSSRARLEARLDQEQAAIEGLALRQQRLDVALEMGKMAVDRYRARDDALVAERAMRQRIVAELQQELQPEPSLDAQRAAILALCESFPELIIDAEPATVARVLQAAGVVVLVEDGAVVAVDLG